ncbi:MAG: GNAT family protein [Dehalococcoidales bacterium]|nr:GNAT family protein [Dehalococcoidales bacterium]
MYLIDGNLVIRKATTDDAEILCKWWNDGRVMEHAGFPKGLGTTTEKIKAEIATDTDARRRRLILEIDSVAAGEMSYRIKNEGVAEFGIKICDFSMQNRGYGTRLLHMLLKHLFTTMGLTKIALDTNLKNTRAQHVYEKIGFRKVAVNLDSWKNQTGELQSSVDYELTDREYLKLIQPQQLE